MSYYVTYSDGRPDADYDTYDAAVEAVSTECAEIGHDGDLSDGGDRTLCWTDEDSSVNDSGANAVCSIRRYPSA